MKQLEQQILKKFLANYYTDNSRSVIINSVWYTNDYHQQVMIELEEIRPTHVFVIALLDPPIIELSWFDRLQCDVMGVGYYPGPGFVDFFALVMDNFFTGLSNDVLLDHSRIDTAFMCLNRKPHPHRVNLYNGLAADNLLEQGFVSLGGNPPLRLLENDCPGQNLAPNGGTEQYGIANDIVTLGDSRRWQRHLVNVVTETVWNISKSNFFSEKAYKPILGLRPFLIYAPNGGVDCLISRGFEPYVNDFTDIIDFDLTQPYNVVQFLKILCQQDTSYFQWKYTQLKEKMLFNQQRFKDYVREQF